MRESSCVFVMSPARYCLIHSARIKRIQNSLKKTNFNSLQYYCVCHYIFRSRKFTSKTLFGLFLLIMYHHITGVIYYFFVPTRSLVFLCFLLNWHNVVSFFLLIHKILKGIDNQISFQQLTYLLTQLITTKKTQTATQTSHT